MQLVKRSVLGIIGGFFAVLIFHQSLWYLLNLVGLIPLDRPHVRLHGSNVDLRSAPNLGTKGPSQKSANFPVFSHGIGNKRAETGSLMTASSANMSFLFSLFGVGH